MRLVTTTAAPLRVDVPLLGQADRIYTTPGRVPARVALVPSREALIPLVPRLARLRTGLRAVMHTRVKTLPGVVQTTVPLEMRLPRLGAGLFEAVGPPRLDRPHVTTLDVRRASNEEENAWVPRVLTAVEAGAMTTPPPTTPVPTTRTRTRTARLTPPPPVPATP